MDMKTTMNPLERDEEINLNEYSEEPWNIIGSYFEGKHLKQLVRHRVESYNDFVTYQIQKTISMFNPVHIHSEQDYVKEFN